MIDRVEIQVYGGAGGHGCSSFRREKFVPRGGPDGGDGGDGGSVVIVADRSVRTLKELGRRRIYRAETGRPGEGGKRNGRRGESLVIMVPFGTEVTRLGEDGEREQLGELVEEGVSLVVAKGGSGGWGNARFATSVQRAPRIAQRGQRGEQARLVLDLKLLADVGIVGLPNAGKSTLLRAISAARPKVADYPFTTLEAVLGVVEWNWETFVVADVPGLIEGAHEGAGLGLEFLRHIERTKVLLYLLDGGSADPIADLTIVEKEVVAYSKGVAGRPRLVAVNKIDKPEVRECMADLRRLFQEVGTEVLFVSAAGREGLDDLIGQLGTLLRSESESAQRARPVRTEPLKAVLQPVGGVDVSREDGAFRVDGERAVAFAEMMPVETEEGRAELWRRFKRWGVAGALRRAGARRGDRVRFGDIELELEA